MNTIYLHVGAGKTGTSALQVFFKLNERQFQQAGWSLPSVGRAGRRDAIAHHKLSDHGPYRNSNTLGLWERLADSSCESMIVTSEYFHNRIGQGDGRTFFEAIRSALDRFDIKVVFYIRRQSLWLESAYGQFVKGASEVRTFAEFVSEYSRNLSDQVFKFADVFGDANIIVRPYSKRMLVAGDVCQDFVSAIDLKCSGSFKPVRRGVNLSLTSDAVEFKRRLNLLPVSAEQNERLLVHLQKYSSQSRGASAGRSESNRVLLDPKTALQIERQNEANYRGIASRFRPDLGQDLFHDSYVAQLKRLALRQRHWPCVRKTRDVEDYLVRVAEKDLLPLIYEARST